MLYPKTLLIEVTNRCNADCVFCGRRWWDDDRRLGHFSYDLFKELLDDPDLANVNKVKLGQYGEPLLWPHLAEATRYAKTRGRYVWTTTNAELLTEERGKALLDAGLDKIIFSVDSIDPEIFNKLRPGLDWHTVIRNIEAFRQLTEGHQIETIVNVVGVDETDKEHFRDFWSGIVDGVGFTPEVDVSPPESIFVAEAKPVVCERPTDHLTIRVDGTVVLCCRDCHTVYTFGNIQDEAPLAIFNSDAFNQIRKSLITGQEMPAICVGCRAFWKDCRPPRRAR